MDTPRFSKVCFMPLCFQKISALVPVFTRKEIWKGFSLLWKKGGKWKYRPTFALQGVQLPQTPRATQAGRAAPPGPLPRSTPSASASSLQNPDLCLAAPVLHPDPFVPRQQEVPQGNCFFVLHHFGRESFRWVIYFRRARETCIHFQSKFERASLSSPRSVFEFGFVCH